MAIAQAQNTSIDLGDRFSTVSLATWVWAAGMLLGGVVARFARDLRTHTYARTAEYIWPTVFTCVTSGFLALGATEYAISKGYYIHPMAEFGIVVAASVNNQFVINLVKRAALGLVNTWVKTAEDSEK